jgi:pimeloyl-ACP methyl ester carboxylesterase
LRFILITFSFTGLVGAFFFSTGIWFFLAALVLVYLILSLVLAYLVQEFPRKAYHDVPDWGRIRDARIPTVEGGHLEVWRVEPDGPSRGIVVLAHGWGRNRDRMVARGRIFGRWGFTVVIHSARDHGQSSRRRFMNAVRMAEDIESVLEWVGKPVLLYGHSAGAAAAIIAASRRPEKIQLLFLEACYVDSREALISLYRWFSPLLGMAFGHMIVFWMNLFYRNRLKDVSPARLAALIHAPVMIIHGAKDQRFPVEFAFRLKSCFPPERSELFVAQNARHSESSFDPGYPPAIRGFIDRHLGSGAENNSSG